jgi:hypothetical protein
MAEVKPLDVEEIRQANLDLADRIDQEGITLEFNPEADVLSITIGAPKPSVTEPIFDDVMCRVAPRTLKITGFEVVAFSSDFIVKNKLVQKALKGHLQELRQRPEVVVSGAKEREQWKAILLSFAP